MLARLFPRSFQVSETFYKSLRVIFHLMKILAPFLIVVKVLEEMGIIKVLGEWISPLMGMVGLPGGMGLVFISGLVTGVYGSIPIFISLLPSYPISVAETTVLMSMVLIAHAYIPEQVIITKLGLKLIPATLIRTGAAFLYGALLYWFYTYFNLLQYPLQIIFLNNQSSGSLSWGEWFGSYFQLLGITCVMIFVLVFLLRLIEISKLNHYLITLLAWVLKPFGISASMATITSIGLLLGISYGGGLMLEEMKVRPQKPKAVFLAIILISLSHSLIEDTLITLSVGGDISGVFFGRIIFTAVLMVLIKIIVERMSERWFVLLFFRTKNHKSQ